MRRTSIIAGSVIVALALVGCEQLLTDIDPEFENPVDPESEEYQGFESVDDPNAVDAEDLDTEADGPFYFAPGLVASELVGAEAYEFQVATAADFEASQIVITEQSESNVLSSWTPPGEGEYFWRVRARSGGEESDWGAWSSEYGPVELVDIGLALSAPAENATIPETSPTFSWSVSQEQSDSGITGYRLEVAEDSGFSQMVTDETVGDSSEYQLGSPLDNLSEYWWRVAARDRGGRLSVYSPVQSFEIDLDLEIPALELPADGAVVGRTSPELMWYELADAQVYEIEIASSDDFSEIVERDVVSDSTSYTVSEPLENLSEYWWRVRAQNPDGVKGEWSSAHRFTVELEVPDNPTPADGGLTAETRPFLGWDDVASAATYDVQLSSDENFDPDIAETFEEGETGDPTSEYAVQTVLENNSSYYWRARIENPDGVKGAWSSAYRFTVELEVPVLQFPADGTELIETTPELTWYELADTQAYEIEIASKDQFDDIVEQAQFSDATSYRVSEPLENLTEYWWRIRAQNADGVWSESTEAWSFSVELEVPALSGPQVTTDTRPLLQWEDVASAESYDVELHSDGDFDSLIEDETGIAEPRYQVDTELENGSTYYWRVRIKNDDGVTGRWNSSNFTVVYIYAFTEPGTHTWSVPDGITHVAVLVVGGGGSGGRNADRGSSDDNYRAGGGGGAGGLVFVPEYDVTHLSEVDISIGEGAQPGDNEGGDSSFHDLIAIGGGSSPHSSSNNGQPGLDGGSGGGAYAGSSSVGAETGGDGIQPQSASGGFGNDGGDSSRYGPGGGGGGAGGAGTGANGGAGLSGVEIDGISYSFVDLFGTDYGEEINGDVWFAGGGAGAQSESTRGGASGEPGQGGGGAVNSDALPNSGGGGGGSTHLRHAGSGGDGIVLIIDSAIGPR